MTMENGVTGARSGEVSRRAWTKDAVGAIALAEGTTSEHVIVALDPTRLDVAFAERNAFDEPVRVEHAASVAACAARFVALVKEGKRAALVAGAHELTGARDVLRAMHGRRVGTVVHAIAEHGASDAWALADLGWGVLFASSVEESIDLTLVARRAAEDCGTPFFVVHERHASARHVEAALPPSRELVTVFVGPPRGRAQGGESARPPAGERAFAERVQFALGSAMRELESLTGRRHDVVERVPAGDAPVVLIGLGELGDSLIAGVERLRANGHEVGAVKLVALRPFPGPRLVKVMARAHGITALETTDEPLAQSNPLTRELKAAFADAITWAPEYPGIGRIPRIASCVVAPDTHALEAEDLDAIVHNMLADERGRRSFALGQGEPLAAPPPATSARPASHAVSMRGFVRDAATAEACAELCAAVVSSALGLHVRGSVRRASPVEGGGVAFDVLAARERPRGAHAPQAVRLVAMDDRALLERANPLLRLADEGVVAVPSLARSADAVWSEIPSYAKAIVFDRAARVVGFPPDGTADGDARERAWMVASAFAGLALAVGSSRAHPVDASLVGRETAEALRAALGADGASAHGAARSAPDAEAWVTRGADTARRAFEAHVDVPRATVERDGESIRLGRRDARISQPPR